MNKKEFMKACEKEVSELARTRPILCPIFEVMAEKVDQNINMSVTCFVDMCLTIAESRGE